MAFMEWDEKLLATGINEVDEQHKKFIQIINDLDDAMKQGKGRGVAVRLSMSS